MSFRTAIGFLVAPTVVPIGLLLTERLHSEPIAYRFGEVVFGFLIWYIYPLLFTVIFAVPLSLVVEAVGKGRVSSETRKSASESALLCALRSSKRKVEHSRARFLRACAMRGLFLQAR